MAGEEEREEVSWNCGPLLRQQPGSKFSLVPTPEACLCAAQGSRALAQPLQVGIPAQTALGPLPLHGGHSAPEATTLHFQPKMEESL